jgi:diguanylate cyclase
MADELAPFRGPDGIALAHGAVDLLRAHGIPTTPANYEIWMSHKLGVNPDLSRAIQARLTADASFTDEVNDELFQRFFASTRLSAQVIEASEVITRELSEAVTTLRNAGEESGALSTTLQTAAMDIEGEPDPKRLRSLVATLAVATREMAERNLHLSEQMEVSARKVESLQASLESVKVEALTDALTGLANRRYLDETLRRRVTEAEASREPLCLVLCDIDHFKRFNDTWGHAVGDQVIRFIAGALRLHAGGDYLAARYGGEEFALIMPRTSLNDAQRTCAELQESIRSKRLSRRSSGETLGSVTISIGIARRRDNENPSDLVKRADACLYASKRGGRDRITTDEATSSQSSAA